MTVSFLIPIKDDISLKDSLKQIINNISASYPKGKTEIVLLVVGGPFTSFRTIQGPPLIKIRYYKDYAEALNHGMEHALGDLIIIAKVKTEFSSGKITAAVQSLEQNSALSLFIEKDWMMLDKLKTPVFPGDIFCLKSFLILYFMVYGHRVIGSWGKINRKEALRFSYKMDKISFRDKLGILWGCR